MSVEAITWALKENVTPSSMKFVLVVLANCANPDTCEAYPSGAYLVEATCQDRKTVQANIRRLIDLGYIADTGKRIGKTKQVIVYRLNCPWNTPDEEAQKRAPLKRPVFPPKEARFSPERGPKTGHGTQRKLKETKSPQTPHGGWPGNEPKPDRGGHPGFETFFAEFPKQVDQATARAEWDALAPDAALQQRISQSITAWRNTEQWQRGNGSRIPKPHNWLRNQGWLNVAGIAPPPAAPAKPKPPEAPAAPMPQAVRDQAKALLGREPGRNNRNVQTSAHAKA